MSWTFALRAVDTMLAYTLLLMCGRVVFGSDRHVLRAKCGKRMGTLVGSAYDTGISKKCLESHQYPSALFASVPIL